MARCQLGMLYVMLQTLELLCAILREKMEGPTLDELLLV